MIGMTLFFMNIIGGNITLVIDPLEKAIGYKEALFLFWPVLAATGNLHKLCQLLDYGQEMMDLFLHFKAASVSYLQAFQQKASSLKIRVKKCQRSDSP